MLKSSILLSVVACALSGSIPEVMQPRLDGRIVGGSPTNISSFPWQVSLQRYGAHICGGSIYSTYIIVTAAHCLEGQSVRYLKVRAGSSFSNSGGMLVNVAAFKIHEGFKGHPAYLNDIGVIRLSTPLTLSPVIRAISLAISTPANGTDAAVSGWGHQIHQGQVQIQLRYIDTKILDRNVCASDSYAYGSLIKQNMMICAASAGKDACQGDSGGPLVSGNMLVGVVSWGEECALENYPGVYTDVAVFRSWIIRAANSV